jgi:O-antigen ligase
MSSTLQRFSGVALTLAAFMGLLPFMMSRQLFFGAVNAKYFFIVTVVSLLALYVSYLLITGKLFITIRKRWLLLLSALLLLVYYLAAFMGVYPERSLFSDIIRSTGVLFITYTWVLALIAGEFVTERGWMWIRRTIAVSAALISVLTILGVQGLGFEGRIIVANLSIPGVTLANEVYAGAFLFLAFMLTFIEFVRTTSRKWKIFLGSLALVQLFSPTLLNPILWMGQVSFSTLLSDPLRLVGSARASSATAFLVLTYMAGYYLLRFLPSDTGRRYARSIWALGLLVGIGTALSLLFTPGSFVQEKYIEISSAARIIVWEGAWEAVQDRPLLGYGPENFRLAYQSHFDNRLYEDVNFGETWFDRAHNVMLDTLVSVGFVGLGLYLILGGYFLWVIVRASRRGLISTTEAHLWGALVVGHGLQLQTFFEVGVTYALMGMVLGYGLYLEKRMLPEGTPTLSPRIVQIGGVVFAVIAVIGLWQLFFVEYKRQDALYRIFVTPDAQTQTAYIHTMLARQSDFETLRFGFGSLVQGLFEQLQNQEIADVQPKLTASLEQLHIYQDYLRAYVEQTPDDYRARMNYAYCLLVLTTLGEDHLAEAKSVIENSYVLSPQNPLTYALEGVAELYSGNLEAAREKINEAVALNPEAPFSQEMAEYLIRQERNFPNIGILRLENL